MAGLLDFLSTPEGRLGMGLLAAAGPSERPLSFGQRLQMGMQTADDSNNQLMRQKLMQSQVDENTSQAEIRKAAVERARRIQEIVSAATANGGPIDYQSLARQGVPIDVLKGISDSANLGRQKVARTVKGMGADGREYEYQVDEFGQRVGEGMAQHRAPIQVDTGGSVNFLDPYNLSQINSMGKSMTPEGKDASARGWASNKLASERLAFDKTGGADGGKPVWNSELGGFVDPKTRVVMPAMDPQGNPIPSTKVGGMGAKVQDANDVLAILDMVDPLLNKSTGSYAGAALDAGARVVGYGTPGANAAAELKALQGALIGKMPKMSGPQSDKDVQLYREMAGQIGDSTMPIETRRAAANTVRMLNNKYASGGVASKGGATGSFGAPVPMKGMVRNGYRFKGGDPADKANWEMQ